MSEKPEALRLADALDGDYYYNVSVTATAAELRRLHAANVDCTSWYHALRDDYKTLRAECDALKQRLGQHDACNGVMGERGYVPECISLRAERDALRADAERYRYLRECARATSEHWGGRWSLVTEGPAPESNALPAGIDAAIDAARALKEAK